MNIFDISAVLLSLTAGFGCLNYRFIGLPISINWRCC